MYAFKWFLTLVLIMGLIFSAVWVNHNHPILSEWLEGTLCVIFFACLLVSPFLLIISIWTGL